MDDVEDLDGMRGQPSDTLVHHEHGNVWEEWESECLLYGDSSYLAAWSGLGSEEDPDDWCVIPAENWVDWGLYQPTKLHLIDYSGANGHADPTIGRNAAEGSSSYFGDPSLVEISYDESSVFEVEDLGIASVPVDVGCLFRTTERGAGEHTQSLVMSDSNGDIVWENDDDSCETGTVYVSSGSTYTISFSVTSSGINESVEVITSFSAVAYQPLLLDDDGTALVRSQSDLSSSELSSLSVENPTYHKNPKSLDAKLIYSLFIPCLGVGAIVFMLMRSMARGYEYEMNKCYGCDLCDDACPVRLFNAGDKLNIIYNTWNNEDDGVPLYSCLTCSACTNACPQLVDYDSYVDIRRNMIVGGPPASEIPHTVLQAVLAAEAEEDSDSDFISVDEYPIDSNIGYYPGCVDYLDQEMIFSHVNEGSMNLGDATTSAFTLFEEMGEEVTYLGLSLIHI